MTTLPAQLSRWYGRSVYFIMTDRFAQTERDDVPSCAGDIGWCGGTFRGIQRKLDYIQQMGFDAIWITPPVQQADWLAPSAGQGYHGYWAKDFYRLEPHFGTEQDLLDLKGAMEERGMLLMVDVVANHVGPIESVDDMLQLGPGLNWTSGDQFHQLGRRTDQSLDDYFKSSPPCCLDAGSTCYPWHRFDLDCNYTIILEGWFYNLADLNQEDRAVRDYLVEWVSWFGKQYRFDGMRLDTAMFMPKWFLEDLQKAAGMLMMGEVTTKNMSFHRSFVPPLSGMLNFPITSDLADHFSVGSLVDLQRQLSLQDAEGYPDLHLLGNFVDNHDGERAIHRRGMDLSRLQNCLAWVMLYHGIPIVYYGTEQLQVSNQSDKRMSMWPYYGETELTRYLASLNQLRQMSGLTAGGAYVTSKAEIVHAEDNIFVFIRGPLLVLLSSAGADSMDWQCVSCKLLPDSWAEACREGQLRREHFGGLVAPQGTAASLCTSGGELLPAIFTIAAPVGKELVYIGTIAIVLVVIGSVAWFLLRGGRRLRHKHRDFEGEGLELMNQH